MPVTSARRPSRRLPALRARLLAPRTLAFLPALTLGAYWAGGQAALLATAVAVPAVYAVAGLFGRAPRGEVDGLTGLPPRDAAVAALDAALPVPAETGRAVAALAAAIDRPEAALSDLGPDDRAVAIRAVADRIAGALRDRDVVARSGEAGFVVALLDLRRADREMLAQIAQRLQDAVAEPISVSGTRLFLTLSVGFALPGRLPAPDGARLIEAAELALASSRAAGGSTVRGWDPALDVPLSAEPFTDDEIAEALETGGIVAFVQPQVAAADGRLLGFEALARWQHPTRGMVMPADFLPRIEAAGLSRRLSEVMLYAALGALRDWDRAGLGVPTIAVNFTRDDLAAPDLPDRIRWDLDRFDLTPDRLVIEVLETAALPEADGVARTLRALRAMGCGIDLDDFGTGQTSVAGLRRLSVSRIKIDRSLVTNLDRDAEQRRLAAALVTMAQGLGIATLAEGVERVGERAALVELGCDAVQGFGIARPMPVAEAAQWIAAWRRRTGLPAGLPEGAREDAAPPTLHILPSAGKTA
jgi:diguanylate cyclase (GGDEF)-like protein